MPAMELGVAPPRQARSLEAEGLLCWAQGDHWVLSRPRQHRRRARQSVAAGRLAYQAGQAALARARPELLAPVALPVLACL